jgi:phage/conjugal plasmid C-4 type zinc finger TraR family protein
MIGEDMATGWAREGAVEEQIEDTVTDGVLAARARLPTGEGSAHCDDCGNEIPESRRRAMPGARTCVPCQSGRDGRIVIGGINRRGSKDSQLR